MVRIIKIYENLWFTTTTTTIAATTTPLTSLLLLRQHILALQYMTRRRLHACVIVRNCLDDLETELAVERHGILVDCVLWCLAGRAV